MKFTISELNNMINLGIDNAFPKDIKLSGEISNLRNSRGHLYMNLKDSESIIRAILWKSTKDNLKNNKDLAEGNKVDIIGHLNYYVPGGSLSFIIDNIEIKKNIGKIKKQYEKLKKFYKEKGYFDPNKKKQLPRQIRKVSIITSQEGAALQDILYTFKKCKLNLEIKILGVVVQGKNCAKDVSNAIDSIEKDSDVVLITRGGGDMEDLFGFSDSLVIEAIHNCPIYTISAIGHEIDFMLSDFVADHRAPTPSIAAEFISLNNKNFIENIEKKERLIIDLIKEKLNNNKLFLLTVKNQLEDPVISLNNLEQKVLCLLESKLSFYQGNINLYNNQLDLIKPQKEGLKLVVGDEIIKNLKSFKKVLTSKEIPCILEFYDGTIEIIIKTC
jgi:exodeoxyribonuclease VII large subunit